MADILINEISQNYSYVIGDNSYCCVALPITASWGPAYTGVELVVDQETGKIGAVGATAKQTVDDVIAQATEDTVWTRFKANSQGLESFVSTYRGAAANYRLANDYSYQMAVSLLTAGYDVLVCRVSPGKKASGKMSTVLERIVTTTATTDDDYVVLDTTSNTLSIKLNRDPIDEKSFVCTSTNPNFSSWYNRIRLDKDGVQTTESKKWIEYDGTGQDGPVLNLKLPTDVDSKGNRLYPDWDSVGIMADDSITINYATDIHAVGSDGKVTEKGSLTLTAKYPGTFGNNIRCSLRKMENVGLKYWNLITYIQDTSGVRLAVENVIFTFDIANSTDNIPYIDEINSQFVDIVAEGLSEDTIFAANNGQSSVENANTWVEFSGGSDKSDETDIAACLVDTIAYVGSRYSENPKKDREYTYTAKLAVSKDILAEHTSDTTAVLSVDEVYNGLSIKATATAPIHDGSPAAAPSLTKGTHYTVSGRDITFTADGIALFANLTDEYIYEVDCTYTGWYSQTMYMQEFCDLYNRIIQDGSHASAPIYPIDATTAQTLLYREWLFTNCLPVYGLLTDKLAYNPNRLISPGWDDQDFLFVTGESKYPDNMQTPSPLQIKLMDVAYGSRCATAYLDIPRSLPKAYVTNSSQIANESGYAQKLSRYDPGTDGLRSTHAALFGPWGNYIYVGTNKQNIASPSFLALLIQRSMVLNQTLQYEWIQPTTRKNSVRIGKMDYTVSKKYLDLWQPDPDTEGGVGVNALANIPDLGLSVWGDSTLYENPPATYQALRNLSTRLLVNAIKNVVYKVGISITFQYTNQTAFSSFYVGVTPILDSMKNAGAIGDYKVVIGNDFDAIGMVKANSCVGKIYITPNGTIQRITIDLIALPPQTDLTNYT